MAYDRQAARAQAEASRLEQIRKWDEEAGAATASPSSGDNYATVQAARAEWERSAAIRDEFTSLEAFMAFRKAEAKGLVKILRKT